MTSIKEYIENSSEVESKLGGVKKLGWMVGGVLIEEAGVEKSANFGVPVYGENGDKMFANIQLTRFQTAWKVDTFYLDR